MIPYKNITVLVADDHMIIREGICSILEAADDIEVVGQAQDGRQAVELAQKLFPVVVVMDISMPRLNGLEAARQILKIAPATRILILSSHSDDAYVEQVMAMGAAGYLIKQKSLLILVAAVREASKGNTFFSPSIAKRLRDKDQNLCSREGLPSKKITKLTSREVEVLALIAAGKANKETAAELGISLIAVEKHMQTLMAKLDLHDVASLTRYAIAAGIIENRVQLTII